MTRRRHAQAHLPPLEGDDALRFVGLLQRIIDAVWRAHGLEMTERLMDRSEHCPNTDPSLDDVDELPF